MKINPIYPSIFINKRAILRKFDSVEDFLKKTSAFTNLKKIINTSDLLCDSTMSYRDLDILENDYNSLGLSKYNYKQGIKEAADYYLSYDEDHYCRWLDFKNGTYVVNNKKRVRASSVLIKENCILGVKHFKKDGWGLPGGCVEVNETVLEAGIRELKEEMTLMSTQATILPIKPFKGKFSDHVFVQLETIGKMRTNKEIFEHKWLSLDGSSDGCLSHLSYLMKKLTQ
tara:strand:- start:285 stop:968 length:684 start_codon:yes stop_codon:yes gene_type:complete